MTRTMNRIIIFSMLILMFCAACGVDQSEVSLTLPNLTHPLERDIRSGTGNGPEVVSNAGLRNPGLAGFNFDFVGDVDDEIERIMVMSLANGMELEFSPTLPNHRDYNWTVMRQPLPTGTKFHQLEDCHEGGGTLLPHRVLEGADAEGVPVLVGFHIWRSMNNEVSSFEIQVSRIPAYPAAVLFYIAFSDANNLYGGPPFCYVVDFAMVPENKVVAEVRHTSGRAVAGSDVRRITAQQPVLQGFELYFVDREGHSADEHREEHNLDEVGVMVSPTSIVTAFNDKNDDDLYRWAVRYADIREISQLTDPTPIPPGSEELPDAGADLPRTGNQAPPETE